MHTTAVGVLQRCCNSKGRRDLAECSGSLQSNLLVYTNIVASSFQWKAYEVFANPGWQRKHHDQSMLCRLCCSFRRYFGPFANLGHFLDYSPKPRLIDNLKSARNWSKKVRIVPVPRNVCQIHIFRVVLSKFISPTMMSPSKSHLYGVGSVGPIGLWALHMVVCEEFFQFNCKHNRVSNLSHRLIF